jgi:ABC-type sugar transport system permease subunit
VVPVRAPICARTPGARWRRKIGLLSPALLLVGAVLGWEIWTSFTHLSSLQDGGTAFVGLENYRRQLDDSQFWIAATVTIVHAATTAANNAGLT